MTGPPRYGEAVTLGDVEGGVKVLLLKHERLMPAEAMSQAYRVELRTVDGGPTALQVRLRSRGSVS